MREVQLKDAKANLSAVVDEAMDGKPAVDPPTARIAGAVSDRARGLGQAPGFADLIIAATAHQHRLTILSRNPGHFQPPGVPVLDPFATLPPV